MNAAKDWHMISKDDLEYISKEDLLREHEFARGELEKQTKLNERLQKILSQQLERLVTLESEINALPDVLLLLNPDCTIQRANNAALRFFGVEELILKGKTCDEVVCACGSCNTKCVAAKAIEDKAYRSAESFVETNKVWLEIRAYPIFDDAGNIARIMEHIRDITDRKNAEIVLRDNYEKIEAKVRERTAELRKAQEAADSANQAKTKFLAHMSHEIRTPMNSIMGTAELLMMSKMDPQQESFARTIADSAASLLKIINNILDISKIEAGRVELEKIEITFRDLMDSIRASFYADAAKKGINLIFSINPMVPSIVLGDQLRLRQILVNLIGNAIKFTEKGGVTVSIGLKETPPDSQGKGVILDFSVADTGIGIAQDKIGELFTGYKQADKSTARKYGGTGLGLAISVELVKLMGGSISVESVEGKGSAFLFTLPFDTYSSNLLDKLFSSEEIKNLDENTKEDAGAGWNFKIEDEGDKP